MDVPLSDGSTTVAAGPADEAACAAAPEPEQPLPNALRRRVRLLLSLSSFQWGGNLDYMHGRSAAAAVRRLRQARLMGGLVTVWGLCMANTGCRAFVFAGAEASGVAGAIFCFLCWPTLGATNFYCVRDVLPHLLRQLDAPVTTKAATAIKKRVRGMQALVLFVGFWGVIMVSPFLAYESLYAECHSEICGGPGGSHFDPGGWWQRLFDWITAAVVVLLSPVFAAGTVLLVVPPCIVFPMAADQVDRLASDIRRSTAATADHAAFTSGAFRAHTDTARLSALMQPQLLGFMTHNFFFALLFLFWGLGPRPPSGTDNWYNLLFNEYFCVGMSTLFAANLVFNLLAPASVTSACQRVADAVNGLRVTPNADGTAELATTEQLHRIEVGRLVCCYNLET